jgi:hypothetical protein
MEFTESNFEQLQDDLQEEQENCRQMRRTLEKAADRLAEIGLIDNFPHAKHLFVSGEREL